MDSVTQCFLYQFNASRYQWMNLFWFDPTVIRYQKERSIAWVITKAVKPPELWIFYLAWFLWFWRKKKGKIVYPLANLVSLEEEEALGDFSRGEMSPGSKCVSQSLLFTLSDKTVVPPFCFRGHGSSEAFTTTSLALDSKWGFAKVIWCKELLSFLI